MKIQGQEIESIGDMWHIHINKPIYGTCVALNSQIVREAIDRQKILKVSTGSGKKYVEEVISPWGWVDKSIVFKKKFRYEKPMMFYQASISNIEQLSLL